MLWHVRPNLSWQGLPLTVLSPQSINLMPSKAKTTRVKDGTKHSQDNGDTNDQKVGSEGLPPNWPPEIDFLTDQTYSAAVPPESRAGLSRTTAENEAYTKVSSSLIESPSPRVSICIVDNPAHPAHGQRGLFAAQHLEPDSFILLYLGHVHSNSLSDTDPHSDYDLSLDRELGLSVDAARSGNESRFANDYRGIAERPNAEFRDIFIQVPSERRAGGVKWERRCSIFVLPAGRAGKRKAGIRAGEEITVSYGKSFWESRKLMATFRKDFEMREFFPSEGLPLLESCY